MTATVGKSLRAALLAIMIPVGGVAAQCTEVPASVDGRFESAPGCAASAGQRPPANALRSLLVHPTASPGPQGSAGLAGSGLAGDREPVQRGRGAFAYDKLQHVTFSFLIAIGAQYALVNKFESSEADAAPVSLGLGLGVGVAKELYDRGRSPSGRFDVADLGADLVGLLLAGGLILL